jgi:hypothetical protein
MIASDQWDAPFRRHPPVCGIPLFVGSRPCLPRDWLGFVKSPKKFFSKSISIFLFFISQSITFYHFLNKKITTKQKISLFYTKYSYFFSSINQICYSINPLLPIQSLPKHNLSSFVLLKTN